MSIDSLDTPENSTGRRGCPQRPSFGRPRCLTPPDRLRLIAHSARAGDRGRPCPYPVPVAGADDTTSIEPVPDAQRVLGALDTPVPYAPPLEEHYLVSAAEIERAKAEKEHAAAAE